MTYTIFILDTEPTQIWWKNGSECYMFIIQLLAKYPVEPIYEENSKKREGYISIITLDNVIDFLSERGFTKCDKDIDSAYLLTAYEHIHVLSFRKPNNILSSVLNIVRQEIYED